MTPWNQSKYSGLQKTLLRCHNSDLRARMKNTHRLYENKETYCKFFLLPKSISSPNFIITTSKPTEKNIFLFAMHYSWFWSHAASPVETFFEILSYQELSDKKLATGIELCAKIPIHSGVIKNSPALTSQRFKNISWVRYNFKRKRLGFFMNFLNCSSKLSHNLLQYIKFKKNRI